MSELLSFDRIVFGYGSGARPILGGRDGRSTGVDRRDGARTTDQADGAGGTGGADAGPDGGLGAGLSLGVESGSVCAILGPNGAGKTTLLHIALGWLKPRSGRVLLDGLPLGTFSRRDLGREIALVPQSERTPFALSVLDYVILGRAPYIAPLAMPDRQDARIAFSAIEEVGLESVAHRPLTTLSGGERQRAVLARAFAQQPRLLLMDEPTAHLDLARKASLIGALRQRVARGLTVLLTTHEPEVAAAVATHLVLMRDGQVRRAGPTDAVFNEADLSATYGVPVRIGSVDGRRVAVWI